MKIVQVEDLHKSFFAIGSKITVLRPPEVHNVNFNSIDKSITINSGTTHAVFFINSPNGGGVLEKILGGVQGQVIQVRFNNTVSLINGHFSSGSIRKSATNDIRPIDSNTIMEFICLAPSVWKRIGDTRMF